MEEQQRIELKNKFIELLKSTDREGVDKLLDFLEKSDFYTAPASTRFHGCYKGGLLEHSMHVYQCLQEQITIPLFKERLKEIDPTSLIICPLLHDICKSYYYAEDTRNVKNKETGQWEQVPYYTVDNKIVLGEHGDKSVFMISEFIKLKAYEIAAIRWHMGAYEGENIWNSLGAAFEKYPFALALHFADMEATHILEIQK